VENDAFLQEQQARLTDMLRPYQREVNRRQRLADFINQCLRSMGRDDFFQLYELLQSRAATEIEAEAGYEEAHEVFNRLREDATRKVERYQVHFLEDFTRLVQEAGLPLDNAFPRFRLLKGMDVEVNFTEKHTLVNGKVLKTVDPQRIMRTLLQLKRRLYDRPFEPQNFIDGLFAVYDKVNHAEGRKGGDAAPIQTVYLEYTLSLQPRSFFSRYGQRPFPRIRCRSICRRFLALFHLGGVDHLEGPCPAPQPRTQ
jgi:hypothetical protein